MSLDSSLSSISDEFPVIQFLDRLIADAIIQRASDIHFEPFQEHYRIRRRIDGVLFMCAEADGELAPRLCARLKIMARLDIAERRLPQDGRFTFVINENEQRAIRVSTCPTLHGEKIVLRILEATATQVAMDALGLTMEQKSLLLQTLRLPQGMILVTGPTGSGKTMTLYTALQQLNDISKNITTVEDPVELSIPGVNQLPVNPKIGLDFSTALRAFLRQDPDVIMVGEIRDQETADIAVKAAHTGHLVLATLHTNSAVETLNRLQHLGIDPYNIATSLQLVIAQRLVRQLCGHCKMADTSVIAELQSSPIFIAAGCEHCQGGYYGRVGVFELLPITAALQNLIVAQASSAELQKQAMSEGMIPLRQAGLQKVADGITSLDELNRVLL